jgi:hypothetical protein
VSSGTTSVAGGWTITVNGSNFAPGAQIIFDGVALSTVWGGTSTLTATAPAHAAGSVLVTAQNPGGILATGSGSIIIAGPVATATATNVPGGPAVDGPLEIEEHRPWPNPISGGSGHVGVKVKGSCDKVSVKVYTPAMVCVGKREVLGSNGAGWVNVELPPEFVLGSANGLYYYVVSVERGKIKGLKPATGRVVLAR